MDSPVDERALLWVLNFSDGDHSIVDIASRSGLTLPVLDRAAQRLAAVGLLVDDAAST